MKLFEYSLIDKERVVSEGLIVAENACYALSHLENHFNDFYEIYLREIEDMDVIDCQHSEDFVICEKNYTLSGEHQFSIDEFLSKTEE